MEVDDTPLVERWLEHTVSEAEAGRLVRDVLTRSLRLSKQMLRRLAQSGGVRLNGARPFLTSRVQPGDRVAVRLSAGETGTLRPVPLELDIRYEDADLLVVNKPAGLLVHPTRRGHVRTLAHGIVHHYRQQGIQARVHPVHRLDRGTSGLVLIAKHPHAHQQLERQLRTRELTRRYWAVVQGVLEAPSGQITVSIGRHPDDPNRRVARQSEHEPGSDDLEACTRFRVLERFTAATLVELELDTGRTHQIRVHMLQLGHPLIGDRQYGTASRRLERQALHAAALSFLQPLTREPIACEAALPTDLAGLLRALRNGEDPLA